MKMIKREVQTFEVGNGFYVDVTQEIEDPEVTEYFLFHVGIGIKLFMFGQYGNCDTEDLILANVDDYIQIYQADYMDEE